MLRYFVAGNLWLVIAAVLLVGGREEVSSRGLVGHVYTFFGVGGVPHQTYQLLVLGCVIAAGLFFFMAWWTRSRAA